MKKQQKALLTILLLMSFSLATRAQKQEAGIYKTFADYEAQRASWSGDSLNRVSIRFYPLFPKKYLTVNDGNKVQQIQKKDIFAYRMNDGKTYRTNGGNELEILNRHPELLLYRKKMATAPKTLPAEQYRYYFSAGDGEVKELTAWNVKQAFAQKAGLADWIDASFRQDSDLIAYDDFHGMYKLEWLLKQ